MKQTKYLGAIALAALIIVTSVPTADAATRRSGGSSWGGSNSFGSAANSAIRKLNGKDALEEFPIPILFGVSPSQVRDTWGEARSNGRSHEGTDIFAPKGQYVVAPTDSVVVDIGFGANGGNFVYTVNPGGERYYFAHLDDYKDGLDEGDVLKKGDLIGYIGNSGNASGGATHLHFGIYAGGAQNPYERLSEEFTTRERIEYAERIIDDADDGEAEARVMVGRDAAFFRTALAAGEELPDEIVEALASAIVTAAPVSGGGTVGSRDLTLGAQGADVILLQGALIKANEGPAAKALAGAGATGYFGGMTQAALAEYQAGNGISPSAGYFGPLTRGKMALLLQ